MKIHQRFSRWQ